MNDRPLQPGETPGHSANDFSRRVFIGVDYAFKGGTVQTTATIDGQTLRLRQVIKYDDPLEYIVLKTAIGNETKPDE